MKSFRNAKTILLSCTLLGGLMTSSISLARTSDRFTVSQNGTTLEITAPRADIFRIRAGQKALPEDASWAVEPAIRAQHQTLDISEETDDYLIKTPNLIAHIDKKTLTLKITDTKGQSVLEDAKGEALRFENGGFRVRKAMPDDEHFFGLGDKTGPMDRRDFAFTLWNTDNYGFGVYSDPIYKSIPYVMGVNEKGLAFGLFMDNSWRSYFDLGKSERNAFAFGAEGGPVDYYVMAGPSPKAVVEQYSYLTGKAPLTPQWALGFQQSHWSYMSQAEARGIADHMRADKLPIDVLYLDIDYQDKNKPFTVNTEAFPDLPGFVNELKSKDMHLVLITDLHIAKAEGQNYAPYEDGLKGDMFVKNADGSNFVGPVWPGPAVFPDFAQPKARDYWGKLYTKFVSMGVGGFWNDMNEPAVFNTRTKTMPLSVTSSITEPGFKPRLASQSEMHNVFGMLNSRATYEGVLKLSPDKRPFVLTRASYAGGQKYAATWTGDNSSTWAHLRLSIAQLNNLGLSGFAYSGDDIGGFAEQSPSPELLTKWIEIGAFNPIFRDHYQKGKRAQEPWNDGAEHEAIRRRYIEERYRLMPYIYGLAEENSRTGQPIMRPVFLEFPEVLGRGERLGDTADHFMLGANLLIALSQALESPSSYVAHLPSGGWYDYWSGARIDTANPEEKPDLTHLPVYVRPGAIIAKQPLVQSTMQKPNGPLELHVYLGADGTASLYFDDGDSLGYQRGDYLRQGVSLKGKTLSFAARQGRFKPWWSSIKVVMYGAESPAPRVMMGPKALTSSFDTTTHTLSFILPDMERGGTVQIK